MDVKEFKKKTLENFNPLSKNIYMEATANGPLEMALDNLYIRFSDNFKNIEELEKILSIVKLYMRIIYKDAPKEMVIQSNTKLNNLISLEEYEERFYIFTGEIRKIELFNKKTKKILFTIKREKAFIPKEFDIYLRINLLSKAINSEKQGENNE